ncbi:MAG: STAS domain-containing protein [Blastocatellia bacterium]|nr:STAS domain-containing protein [Blastocatellia bacterium]MCS7156432.1 STAS domain-containing protein [Blastocatellia bacterium]MCX7751827.1 STAS domain-containing protein [Blastocatellia bacterium]MDW8168929.1 STAS domain-containing protein [Acidobacteriota bacterium]MDW8256689.1 STAS domain-containing protein [Acidobacteriota bacterium]
MIRIEHRTIGDVHILDIEGRITIGEGTLQFREAVHRVLQQGGRKILLNLAGVTHMDSSGIGELVSAYTAAGNRGGRLKLLHVPPRIREVLTITKLVAVFEAFDDEAVAVESFQ